MATETEISYKLDRISAQLSEIIEILILQNNHDRNTSIRELKKKYDALRDSKLKGNYDFEGYDP